MYAGRRYADHYHDGSCCCCRWWWYSNNDDNEIDVRACVIDVHACVYCLQVSSLWIFGFTVAHYSSPPNSCLTSQPMHWHGCLKLFIFHFFSIALVGVTCMNFVDYMSITTTPWHLLQVKNTVFVTEDVFLNPEGKAVRITTVVAACCGGQWGTLSSFSVLTPLTRRQEGHLSKSVQLTTRLGGRHGPIFTYWTTQDAFEAS